MHSLVLAIVNKALFFSVLAAVLVLAVREARLRPWERSTIILALGSGLILLFNAFLVFTYVAHFPLSWAVHAHSYARYMSQLSLVAILALLPLLRAPVSRLLAGRTRFRRRLTAGAIACVVLLPLAAIRALRFDLAMPQPLLWSFAHRAEPYLVPGQTLALVIPGDVDDAVGSMLRGVLLFTPPRQAGLRFRTELTAGAASLDDAARSGATTALVTCSGAGLSGLPPGAAGLLARDGGRWHPVAVWPYDRPLEKMRFSAMMPHAPFCGTDLPPTL